MPAKTTPVRSRSSSPATVPTITRIIPPNSSGKHFTQTRRGTTAQGRQPSYGRGARSNIRQGRSDYGEAKRTLQAVSPATPKLAAEYIACGVIIMATTMSKPGDYATKMAEALWKMTAVTAVFFVLAIMSMSKNMSRITVAFGGLIMMGVLFNSSKGVKSALDEAAGQGTGQDTAQLSADYAPSPPEHNILDPTGSSAGG